MGLFERKIRPAFVAAPAEQPVPDEVRIADIDAKLTALSTAPRRAAGVCDRLLELRYAIRPAEEERPAPVAGRVDSIIDNYWENPW